MGLVKVAAFAVSLDGFGAGPNQSLSDPLGVRGTELHRWFFKTQVFRKMHGTEGGGVSTVRQYPRAGLIDEMHLVYSPVYLGKGESLLAGIDLSALGFSPVRHISTEDALHVELKKTKK